MFKSTAIRLSRTYKYDVDVHGQLFLSDTKIRNFTSCYKDPTFIDFLYNRLRRNDTAEGEERRREGYAFVSPCGHEQNYIRAADTPMVFQKLHDDKLVFAGAMTTPFEPSRLCADSRGYVYHPSPLPTRTNWRRGGQSSSDSTVSRYGPYSLLRSSLVLEAFADSLELDDEGRGSYEWRGKRYEIGKLEEGQAWRGLG